MSTVWSNLSVLLFMLSVKQQSMGYSVGTYGSGEIFCRKLELTCESGEKVRVQSGFKTSMYFLRGCVCDECPVRVPFRTYVSNFTSREIGIVKQRCENNTNCLVEPKLILRKRGMRIFEINITYTCQDDIETGNVSKSSEIETVTEFKLLGVNSSTMIITTDKTAFSFSVKNYLAGIGTGVVLIGLPIATLCIVLVRKRGFMKTSPLSPVSKINPTYAGLTLSRLSNIYDSVNAENRA